MLSETERQEVKNVLTHYRDSRSAVIEALKIVQTNRGWVPDETLPDLGELLGMTAHEIDSLATFYSLIFRKPVGRHVILACDSVSCWILGADQLRDALFERLDIGFGETTADGRFTLLPICCIGSCEEAPALMIDEDRHGNVAPDRLEEILSAYE